jgi:hypothetical protein
MRNEHKTKFLKDIFIKQKYDKKKNNKTYEYN